MQVKNFRCVVIKKGRILGQIAGKMIVVSDVLTSFFNLKKEPLIDEKNFHLSTLDASKFQAVAGWGEITHIYYAEDEIFFSDENSSAVSQPQAQTKLPKSKRLDSPFTVAAEMA